MNDLIFVANRLPVTINQDKSGSFDIKPSIGGLATGLKTLSSEKGVRWVGWPGLANDDINSDQVKQIDTLLSNEHNAASVHLSQNEIDAYYHGFCNSTIWPLFHYFPNITRYQENEWLAYKKINHKFFEVVKQNIKNGDIIWIHDYQLMLLPGLIKAEYPNVQLGFFLHIPFPSYELFRLIPWRNQILNGILGADLIGFHTYDYARHFLSSTRRILGLEHNMNFIQYSNRQLKVDVFPMGIDYQWFADAFEKKAIRKEAADILMQTKGSQIILSVDRLDYSKGIPGRIKAFEKFLESYSEYLEKVTLVLIVAPSRTDVDIYDELRREIEELVSHTNGCFGTIGWVPVWFFYRSFQLENLIAFYQNSDVMLVTPLRDGMNLVAKEYIATRQDRQGVLIISETAGAASELGEAIIVNPHNQSELVQAIKDALEMTKLEQSKRNSIMHKRIERYNVGIWAHDFIDKLQETTSKIDSGSTITLEGEHLDHLLNDYAKSKNRILFLDYDGTLVSFKNTPAEAFPDEPLLELLESLLSDPKNTVVIISGRDNKTLEKWFGHLHINLVASHGQWYRKTDEDWKLLETVSNMWIQDIRTLMERYMDRTPGSHIEEKEYSIAWHYRKCEPELAQMRLSELREALMSLISSQNIGVLEGKKVIEVKDTRINKGRGASIFLAQSDFDFTLALGDDVTDEDLFAILPDNNYTIKVGPGISNATYNISNTHAVRELLTKLVK